jgi:hypothetical protein
MNKKSLNKKLVPALICAAFVWQGSQVLAADITVTPPVASGFVVKDNTGVTDRFRVDETGTVAIPGLATAPAGSTVTCFGPTGVLGGCSGWRRHGRDRAHRSSGRRGDRARGGHGRQHRADGADRRHRRDRGHGFTGPPV